MVDSVVVDGVIKFLDATVVSYSSSMGFNSSPSTLNVTLIKDIDDVGFNPGTIVFQDGNPGTYADFTSGSFTFGGFVQSWKKKDSINGVLYDVTLADPRFIFRNMIVLTSIDSRDKDGNQASVNQNIVDVLGFHNFFVTDADWSTDGISYRAFNDTILGIGSVPFGVWEGLFYGTKIVIVFDNFGPPFIPDKYRINMHDPSLEELLEKTANDNSLDYYVTSRIISVDPAPKKIEITIHGINRTNQISLSNTDIEGFITHIDRVDRVKSTEIGRELRTDPNNVLLWGDFRRSLWTGPLSNSFDSEISPLYNKTKDGNYVGGKRDVSNPDGTVIDRIFISFENIVSKDFGTIDSLPFVNFEKKDLFSLRLPGFAGVHVKQRNTASSRKGYMATREILRAALHSKSSWITAMYYTEKDGVFNTSKQIHSYGDEQYDIEDPLGGAVPNTTFLSSNVATNIGIVFPTWDRIAPNNLFNPNAAYYNSTNVEQQALIDACYMETLKVAENFYGKVFAVKLPDSPLMNNIISNNSAYSYLERRFLLEYEVVDGSWNVNLWDDEITNLTPYLIAHSDSDLFQTSEGNMKALWRWDFDALLRYDIGIWRVPDGTSTKWNISSGNYDAGKLTVSNTNFTHVDIFQFDDNNVLRIPKVNYGTNPGTNAQLINPSSNFWFYTSDVNVQQYLFDPRFAIVTLPKPVEIGYGPVRNIVIVNDDNGAYTDHFESVEIPKPPTKHDQTGGFQEFISWLYQSFTIVAPDDPKLEITVIRQDSSGNDVSTLEQAPVVEDYNGVLGEHYISATAYNTLMNFVSPVDQEVISFSPRRYTGDALALSNNVPQLDTVADRTFIPLKWNFKRYGPYTFTSAGDGPISVIIDSSLSPWNFGTLGITDPQNEAFVLMNQAGFILANSARSITNTINFANLEIVGFPELNLGQSLGINSVITNISLNYGINGVVTNYQLKTFFGPHGTFKKDNIDHLVRTRTKVQQVQKDVVRLEKLIKKLSEDRFVDAQKGYSLLKAPKKGGSSSKNNLIAAMPRGSQGLHSFNMSEDELIELINKHPDIYKDIYVANTSDLYMPYTTDPNKSDQPGFMQT